MEKKFLKKIFARKCFSFTGSSFFFISFFVNQSIKYYCRNGVDKKAVFFFCKDLYLGYNIKLRPVHNKRKKS